MNDLEIRKLSAGPVFKLSQILECGEDWKKLMEVIPLDCVEGNPPKYTHNHMMLIETAGKCQQRPFTEILLEEWGTSGRRRPTLTVLLRCLLDAQLYRAADFVAEELLKIPPPPRPATGPAAHVKCPPMAMPPTTPQFTPTAPPATATTPLLQELSASLQPSAPPVTRSDNGLYSSDPTEVVKSDLFPQPLLQLRYSQLEAATEHFAESRLLGRGVSGSVHLAFLPGLGAIAVKRLHPSPPTLGGVGGASSPLDPQFQFSNEIKVLAKLSHTNLLPLVGYSDEGPALCIAYKYMRNGSLLDRLACKEGSNTLSWRLRMEIGLGAARGLSHLHNFLPKPLVHRDVKSANILLDDNFTAKLGDFGLVRMGSSGNHTISVAVTSNAAGTSAYMAPEAHRGDVSVKLDVYSFGVVILELLTGLPPFDEGREGHDLVTFVEDAEEPESLVDVKAGAWPQHVVTSLFDLSEMCLKEKRKRPLISEVIEKLTLCQR